MVNQSARAGDKSIQIFGLGYIGLPTAAIMAEAGYRVYGVDVKSDVVEIISRGDIHIEEDKLESLVRSVVSSGNLTADITPRVCDVHIIAVPTPINEDKSPDISYVLSAVRSIATVLRPGNLIIVESTIPPLTCVKFVAPLIEEITGLRDGADYLLAHCPERVIPGKILYELIHNDRIVGGTTEDATDATCSIYRSFVRGKILETDATTAEMCKLMENTFRDVNIALANEFSQISEKIDVDIFEAIKLANHHPRVNIHTPSIGVGGHCIPVDPWFIVHAAPNEAKIIKAAREINDGKPAIVADRICNVISKHSDATVALLGLSYKPDVDDYRESPAIEVVKILTKNSDRTIVIADPFVKEIPESLKERVNVTLLSLEEAVGLANIIVVLVEHSQFSRIVREEGKVWLDINNNFSEEIPD